MVSDCTSKHLKTPKKYFTIHHIVNSLLGVLEIWSNTVFDVLLLVYPPGTSMIRGLITKYGGLESTIMKYKSVY